MKTLQQKEFEYSDILLYKIVESNNKKLIIVIINDEEQLKTFRNTGLAEDAPVSIMEYTPEIEKEIISKMKQIKEYVVNSEDDIIVRYTDGTNINFYKTNKPIIEEVLENQRNYNKNRIIDDWAKMPEEEKQKKKSLVSKKLTKGLAGVLAATVLLTGSYHLLNRNKGKNVDNEMLNPTDPRKTEQDVSAVSDFTKEAETLYNQTLEKNDFVLKYQQVADIKWNKELSLEVVELVNGLYPLSMQYMNEENAKQEMTEVIQAISLLIAGNLNPETSEENMINLSEFIVNEKEKTFVNNALIISRACINESIGEPTNGKIIDEEQWSGYSNFSKEYKNSVDQLLNYEFETINNPEFLTMSAGARYLITLTFQQVNNVIPQWSYITREKSETDTREYDLYYRYFFDDVEKIPYLPREGKNGTTEYVYTYIDENGTCKEEVYTEDVMFAMAGLSTVEEQRNLNIEPNPNIRQLGIQTEIDNRVNDSLYELQEIRNNVLLK